MLFKAVVQSLQYAVYDLEFDTLKEACIAADGINPTSGILPSGITVDLLLSGYNTGGMN
jgi:hypothetical protein